MTGIISRVRLLKTFVIAALLLVCGAGSYSLAQAPESSMPEGPSTSALAQNELENLVAPIALYPDALLSQVLVASTYPLEVMEAQQWLQQNGNLRDRERMVAAQQQNWDPSVQALVAFPDVVALLTRDVRWTTDLGNAFLSQQADVMTAIQNLRAEAQRDGQLASTPQFAVNTETQGEQSAIEIQPTDPQRMYVPNYDPYAVWGAPAEGDYPALGYSQGSGFGDVFGTIANLAGFLPGFGGLLGPRSWGWALGWLAQALFVNNSFFNDFGFHNGFHDDDAGFRGSSVWVHNERHRLGVPYGDHSLAGWHGRGPIPGRQGNGWRNFGNRTAASSGAEPRRTFAPQRSTAGEGFRRDDHHRDDRGERAGNWRSFNANSRTASAGPSGRTFSPPLRTTDRRFAGSSSFGSGSGYNGFANSGTARRPEPSRTLTASRGNAPSFSSNFSSRSSSHVSAARMPSERGSSFLSQSHHGSASRGSSSRGSSSHSFWSHSPKTKHFSAPKVSRSHFPKSHGGGHSSGGHSGKRSHRG